MQLRCPNNHLAVIRQDPETTGMRGMCDTCGWEAPYIVSREDGEYKPDGRDQELQEAQQQEQQRRLTSPISSRRRE